jgi:hypothetical protein
MVLCVALEVVSGPWVGPQPVSLLVVRVIRNIKAVGAKIFRRMIDLAHHLYTLNGS